MEDPSPENTGEASRLPSEPSPPWSGHRACQSQNNFNIPDTRAFNKYSTGARTTSRKLCKAESNCTTADDDLHSHQMNAVYFRDNSASQLVGQPHLCWDSKPLDDRAGYRSISRCRHDPFVYFMIDSGSHPRPTPSGNDPRGRPHLYQCGHASRGALGKPILLQASTDQLVFPTLCC